MANYDDIGIPMDENEIHWTFSQIKGTSNDTESPEADIISAVQFSEDGELLATGDKGGRLVVFQRGQRNVYVKGIRSSEYNVYSTFQSHEPEFDYLKSLEIEEKINQIKWMKRRNAANFLLATNDKTIKLWKLSEREKRVKDVNWNISPFNGNKDYLRNGLMVPKLEQMELVIEASPRRVYANSHTYHINSISVSADQISFISADDLRINHWHHEYTKETFNIVDLKPNNMEELTEVITVAEFHPKNDSEFVYTSSKGTIRLCDMRDRALCDGHAKIYEEPESSQGKSFFSEIISSISDAKFSHNGQFLMTRDYLTTKIWDIRMERRPVETYHIHDHLRSKLCNLYENDHIFDKFEVAWSGCDNHIITGSYGNVFRTFLRTSGLECTYAVANTSDRPRLSMTSRHISNGGIFRYLSDAEANSINFNKKILHLDWHVNENIIAMAAANNLYIFQGMQGIFSR
uniref:Serine/threonine-protein phosphatase 2A 55 kDa regulatory subunit B n=1 Tax=Strongyloides venezuelensis TaxID=75913 RepID=A0A0K0EXT6_STRVS